MTVFEAINSDVAPRVISYDVNEFNFSAAVAELLNQPDLQKLDGSSYELFTRGTDQSTIYHTMFYMTFEPMMGALYRRFVTHVSEQIFGAIPVYYQVVPTLRVQFCGNLGVAEMHTDGEYHHQDGELNFWVPLTRVWGSNSIWIEASRCGRNYQPWSLNPGQALVFDAVNWRHGNLKNQTGCTRVSFDFRVIPQAAFIDSGALSVNAGKRMRPGDYWAAL